MAVTARPLGPLFAAELSGVDLRRRADADSVRAFKEAMARYAVCVVPHDTPPTDAQHIAFSEQLGPVERRQILKTNDNKGFRIPRFEIIDQSNLDETGAIFREDDRRRAFKLANRLWHTDLSFHPIRATYSLLAAHVLPPSGGETEFVDTRAVYEALPARTRSRLEGLVGEHSYWYSRVLGGAPEPTEEEKASGPPAYHGLVHVHPGSGRKALYLASHVANIVGWTAADSRAFLAELMDFATLPRFVFRHAWRVGDVVAWDNLCTMHRATPFDDTRYVRDVRRTTCRERPVPVEA